MPESPILDLKWGEVKCRRLTLCPTQRTRSKGDVVFQLSCLRGYWHSFRGCNNSFIMFPPFSGTNHPLPIFTPPADAPWQWTRVVEVPTSTWAQHLWAQCRTVKSGTPSTAQWGPPWAVFLSPDGIQTYNFYRPYNGPAWWTSIIFQRVSAMTGLDKMIGSSLIPTLHAQLPNFCPSQIPGLHFLVRVSGPCPACTWFFVCNGIVPCNLDFWWAMVARPWKHPSCSSVNVWLDDVS